MQLRSGQLGEYRLDIFFAITKFSTESSSSTSPYPPATFDGKPRRLSGDLQQVMVVHESDQGFGWEVDGANIWWGTPHRGRHGLQIQRTPKPMR
jgi:hypothetical protein